MGSCIEGLGMPWYVFFFTISLQRSSDCFLLFLLYQRAKMKLGTVDCELVDRLVGTHVQMYLDECGGFLDHVP